MTSRKQVAAILEEAEKLLRESRAAACNERLNVLSSEAIAKLYRERVVKPAERAKPNPLVEQLDAIAISKLYGRRCAS